MKQYTLFIVFFIAFRSLTNAQNTVIDTHPNASIFVINYSTGQQTLVTYDAAILFKDALIDLVKNTNIARIQSSGVGPGPKTFVITQLDPQTNGNAYQLVMQSTFANQTLTIYTFVYNADQNTLSFYNMQSQNYVPVPIQGYNVNNLNNCFAYGKFNAQNVRPAQNAADANQPAVEPAADTTAVDENVTATTAPPALPDYDQPQCPTDGYLWQPGFWAYSPAGGYYWVPGVWVAPPASGLLWTPPYWGYAGGIYVFHSGYWGNSVGFYGGVNYGYGYVGHGYVGGGWYGGHYRYNTAVVNVNITVIHNTYVDKTVVYAGAPNHASFNGQGGVLARPNPNEMAAANEHHILATQEQIRNQRIARADKSQFASANGGRPANFARVNVPARNTNVNPVRGVNGNQVGTKPGIGPKQGMPAKPMPVKSPRSNKKH